MKTLKRVFAVIIAVVLVAMMITVVSAAETNTVNWTLTKPGYTYTVYTVATYNSTTGEFTAQADSLKNLVNASTDSTAALAEACKDATLPSTGITFTSSSTVTSGSFTLDNGIYYIKCTEKAPNCKGITQESVVVFPNKDGDTALDVNLSNKVDEGQPRVYKTCDKTTVGSNETITYTLTADIPGTTDSKLTSYVITDKMGTGLDTSKHDVKTVEVINGTTTVMTLSTDQYSVSTDSSVINKAKADTIDKTNETLDNTFGVVIDSSVLGTDSFYGDGNQVVVTYETTIDDDTAAVNTDIPNTDDMIYGNSSGYNVVPGQTVIVKTYKVQALKVDATTGAELGGATFTLYDSTKTKITSAVSDSTTGIADFGVFLPAGTYYVVETEAPDGYNLNSTENKVTLGDTNLITVTVKDTKAKMPSTGGTGTMVFTIIGGSLVLLAAAMFVIVMKKRSSSK